MEKQKIIRIDFNMELLDEIREHFNYNPDEGYLYKIKKTSSSDTRSKLFEPITKVRKSNNTSQNDEYVFIVFKKKSYVSHRIAYMLHYNEILLGTDVIDHKDGNTLNNKINNLVKSTHTGNMKNQKIRTNNSTGMTGVKLTKYGTYTASIDVDKKRICKSFTTLEEAKECRQKWNELYKYTTNEKQK